MLKRKKASILRAPLPPGSPDWNDIQAERMSDVPEKPARTSRVTRWSGSCSPTGASTNPSQNRSLAAFLSLLRRLDGARIAYQLRQFRDDAIAVEVAVPGERWEIEFLEGGDLEIEIFRSNGEIHGAQTLEDLFRRFGD